MRHFLTVSVVMNRACVGTNHSFYIKKYFQVKEKRRIFVRQLAADTTCEHLHQWFQQYGPVTQYVSSTRDRRVDC